jgi:cytosine permease
VCSFPPIGAIILVDQYVVCPGTKIATDYRPMAFVAWAIGSAVTLVVENAAPQYSTALSSMVVGGVAYWALSAIAKPAVQAA